MELDLGYIVAFILTAYSTITTIFPFLTQGSENRSSDTYRFQALYTLLNPRNSQNASKLSANVTLHQVGNVTQQTKDHRNSNDSETLLSLAAMNYDIDNTVIAENLIERAQSHCDPKNSDCLLKIWYLHRLLDINKANNVYLHANNNVVHEDRKCNTTKWDCTQKDVVDIENRISSMSQSGYDLQFYNGKSLVNFLEKPLATFILDLHLIIFICFIIVFIVAIRKRKIINRVLKSN